MQSEYRGHRIRLVAADPWRVEFIELASGVRLPTRLVARPDETFRDFWARARTVIDLYLEAPSSYRVLGPVRPWQTIFEPAAASAVSL